MSETGPVMVGVGRPEGKPSLKDWAKKSFTVEENEVAWRQKHAKEIAEMTAINASLSDKDRIRAMKKLDKDIKNKVVINVAGNYSAAALVIATLTFGGFYTFHEDFRSEVNRIAGELPDLGREMWEQATNDMASLKDGARETWEKLPEIREDAWERAKDLFNEILLRGRNVISAAKGE